MHGEPFLSGNVAEEEKYFRLDERVRSEMAAPLTEGGRTVGAPQCGLYGVRSI